MPQGFYFYDKNVYRTHYIVPTKCISHLTVSLLTVRLVTKIIYKIHSYPLRKGAVFGFFLVRIFTPYLSVFSPNAGKFGPEKLRIRTPFTQ